MRRWESEGQWLLTDGQLMELGGFLGGDEEAEDEGAVEASLWEAGLAALWEAEAAGRVELAGARGTETHHR